MHSLAEDINFFARMNDNKNQGKVAAIAETTERKPIVKLVVYKFRKFYHTDAITTRNGKDLCIVLPHRLSTDIKH